MFCYYVSFALKRYNRSFVIAFKGWASALTAFVQSSTSLRSAVIRRLYLCLLYISEELLKCTHPRFSHFDRKEGNGAILLSIPSQSILLTLAVDQLF